MGDRAAMAGRRVLVTGASGFIGRNLSERLIGAGASVRALVRPGAAAGLSAAAVERVEGRLEDPHSLAVALAGVEVVFHLAGLTRARDLATFRRVNVAGTVNLLRAVAAAERPARVVHVSSLAASGPAPAGGAVDEASPLRPVTHYGRSKAESEDAIREHGAGLEWTIVRPPAVYGPHERDVFNVFRMVGRGCAPILGFGAKHYSFVYVDDLTDALCRLGEHAAALRQVYFVASPEVRSNLEFLAAIEESMGRRAWKPRIPHAVAGLVGLTGSLWARFAARPPLITLDRLHELTAARWVCSVAKLAREVGFVCPTDIATGLRATAAWYRRNDWL